MDSVLQNFLFRNPQYYELAYPEPNDETPAMCRRMFARYLAQPPRSILDVGCGTARHLNSLSRDCPDCWGVDFTPEMIEFARKRHPHLHLQVGDARSVRLGRAFDADPQLGSAFVYAVTNADVAQTLDTFAAHSHPGTLLILDIGNAASFLGGEYFKPTGEVRINTPEFSGHAQATYSFDRRRQLLIRRRKWKIEGQGQRDEYCEHRLFFPAELEHLLAEKGFQVLGMFDNMELRDSDISGLRLYAAAIYRPQCQRRNQA